MGRHMDWWAIARFAILSHPTWLSKKCVGWDKRRATKRSELPERQLSPTGLGTDSETASRRLVGNAQPSIHDR